MKNLFKVSCVFILIVTAVFILPLNSYSETYQPSKTKQNYVAIKGGVYEPDDDLEYFDAGPYGEIALNHYISPNFAMEFAVGGFYTDNSERGTIYGRSYYEDTEIYTTSVTFNLKGIIPFKFGELYLGGGIGGYFVYGEMDIDIPRYAYYSTDDDDFVVGAQLLAGLTFNITDALFIGIEGKYIFTEDAEIDLPEFETIEFNLNGYTITGVFGFRF